MIHRVLSKLPLSTSRMPSSRGICRCGWLDPGFKLLSPREVVLYCIGDGINSSSSACINNKRLVLFKWPEYRKDQYYYVDSACWPLSKYLDNRSGKLKRFGPEWRTWRPILCATCLPRFLTSHRQDLGKSFHEVWSEAFINYTSILVLSGATASVYTRFLHKNSPDCEDTRTLGVWCMVLAAIRDDDSIRPESNLE